MMQKAQKDFSTSDRRTIWQRTVPSADHAPPDVCIVCALSEETQALLHVAEKSYNLSWTKKVSRRYHYRYHLATFFNVNGEPLRVHVSCLPRYGPQEMLCHLKDVIEECQPRFVGMTGICAGDKQQHVCLGDLVVAERVFTYDSGKMVKRKRGKTLHEHDTTTYQLHENTLGFLRLFDDWKSRVAAFARPFSKQQQRDWFLQRLYLEPTGSIKAIPLAELNKFAPVWRQLVPELKQGPAAFLSPKGVLRDKTMIEELYYGSVLFPFQDPPEAQIHICPLASSCAVHSDNPFTEIQSQVRGTRALDMEGAAFGKGMQRFPEIEWLIVKGVSDYADQDKDDSYRTYAAEVSATYMLCVIEAYVTQEQLPPSRSDHNTSHDGTVQVSNIPSPHNPLFTGHDECEERLTARYPKSVVATWTFCFEQVEQKHPAAADLLRLCAFLHPDAIPEEILTAGAKHLGPLLQPVASNPLLLNEALAVLRANSLIKHDTRDKMLSLPDIVQAILKDAIDCVARSEWARRAILAVCEAFPAVEFTTSQQYERCLPQALACAELAEQGDPMLLERASLQSRLGWYQYHQGRYSEAESWYMRALTIREKQLGLEHPDTAIIVNNLAVLYRAQGKYEQGILLYRRALMIFRQQLGPEHPYTINSLNNLAIHYEVYGKYEQAEPLHILAQFVHEQYLGPEHLCTAVSLNNLALHYHHQEKYELAEPLYVQALAIREEQLGPRHPYTAQSLNNLAALYYTQRKYSEAEQLYTRAILICEQQLEAADSDTALSLNNLAALYYTQGKYSEAEQLYTRAISIYEQQLDASHPDIAQSQNNLATVYYAQGKYSEAKPLYQQALATWEHILGPQHPHTQAVCTNYVLLLQALSIG